MTTKLASFKTFLIQKAKKPCGPGQHRHWGYDYCHPITSVHHKHNKMGINPHHGMEFGGAIPTGTIPPNIEDHHHLAKPHGEKTGATGGNCNPVEYPKGSGKVVPAHRHTGADYCHPVVQKHGASAGAAQEWHNTHQADIEQTWKLFNDQQGLEGDTTPGTFDQDAIDDAVQAFEDPVDAEPEVPIGGVVNEINPHGLQVGTTISGGEGYDNWEMQITDITPSTVSYMNTGYVYDPSKVYTDDLSHFNAWVTNNLENALSPVDIQHPGLVDVPDVDPVEDFVSDDFINPEDSAPTFKDILPNLQVGSTINYYGSTLEITKVSDYSITAVDENGKPYSFYPPSLQNDSNISVVDADLEPTGDVVNEINPHELQVGTTITGKKGYGTVWTDSYTIEITGFSPTSGKVDYSYFDSQYMAPGTKDNYSGINLDEVNTWITELLAGGNNSSGTTVQHPGLNDIPNPQSPPIPTGSMDDPYTEEYLNTLPKMGESVGDIDTLVSFPPGTEFTTAEGEVYTLLEVQQGLNADGNKVETNVHLNVGEAGDSWVEGAILTDVILAQDWTVSQLSAGVAEAMDKGFQLGGAVIPAILDDLPVGLVFTYGSPEFPMGTTATITQNLGLGSIPGTSPGDGIKVTFTMSDGTIYEDVPIDSTMLAAISAGAKIVGLPSGIASQQATAKAPAFNKNGLAEGTKIAYTNDYGEKFTGTISYAHKTPKKGGFNYTIDYDDKDGGFVSQNKIHSSLLEDPESENNYGYFVTDAVHKEGMEPDVDPLELPPLGSEPGNFDDVLEQIGGKLGYNEGGTFKHKQTGKEFYIKFSSSGSDEQVKSEALANNLYELLGIGTLGTSLISFKGKTALKSDWNSNLETIPIDQMSQEAGIMDSFVADAWLANWDVIGPNNDNTQKSGNKIIKIDSGGALKFGGAGGAKPFTATVNELETLRDPNKAKVAYQVFQDITTENLVTGAQKLAKVTDAHIDAIVDNSQIPNKENMKEVLKARRDAIVGQLLNESHTAASEGLSHPGQHKHEGGKGWHATGLEHSGTKGNEAHEKLGLPFTAPKKYIGSTLEPGQDFFTTVANSTTIPAQYKTLINKALTVNFNASSASGRRQKIANFLAENNIADTFSGNFNSWQSGGYYTGNIRVAAALFELKGEAAAVRESQANHWGWTMGQAHIFEESWNSGTADALSLVPYLVASQQYVKLQHPDTQFTVHRGLSNSGNNKVGSLVHDALKKIPANKKKTWVGQFPGGPPAVAAGWSENLSTSKGFAPAGSHGIIFKKALKAEDVLLHFKAFSSKFGGEDEVIIDPNSARKFSYDEILLGGIDY